MTTFSHHFNPRELLPRPPKRTKALPHPKKHTYTYLPGETSGSRSSWNERRLISNDLVFCGLSSCASPH